MSDLTTYTPPTQDPISPSADPSLGVLEGQDDPAPEGAPQIDPEPSRPPGLPENYATVEAMAEALASAQQKITELGQAANSDPENLSDLINQAGTEVQASGKISEATASAMEKLGVNADLQRSIIAGTASLARERDAEVVGLFGGREAYEAFAKWAPKNMSNEEITVLNTLLDSAYQGGEMTTASMAIKGALQKFHDGQTPVVVDGSANHSVSNIQPYATKIEAMQAIASPAYKSGDRSFHKLHAARLALTPGIFS